jgi:hypothetical protein
MVSLLLLTYIVLCAVLLLHGMLRRGAIYQYPFLAGSVFTGFALPQFIGLSHDTFLPAGALEKTLLVAILSASMCWLGTVVAAPPRPPRWIFDDNRLLRVSAALSLLGAYFYYKISRLPPEMIQSSQWTGLPVAYLFFARMLTYGFALAVLMAARTGSRRAWLIAAFGATFYFNSIVIGGRRQDAVEFFLIVLLAWWFQRNRCLPRIAMLVVMVAGTLFINSIGEWRSATTREDGPQWQNLLDIDFVGNIAQLAEQGGSEVRNAVYIIAAVDRRMDFDLGAFHWNLLVFSYVPAQLVGADLKNSLYLPLTLPAYDEFFYVPPMGSTVTGFSDTFQSFWYFGCLKFFLIAFVMQKLWLGARQGSLTAQLLYMLLPSFAMESITHWTHNFLLPWPHIGIFLIPALLWARRPRPGSAADQRSSQWLRYGTHTKAAVDRPAPAAPRMRILKLYDQADLGREIGAVPAVARER